MGDALDGWLAHGVDGISECTVTLYRGTTVKALNEELGKIRLTELTASHVQGALVARLSTRTVQIAHNVLVRAIRHAGRDDLWGRAQCRPIRCKSDTDAVQDTNPEPGTRHATAWNTGASVLQAVALGQLTVRVTRSYRVMLGLVAVLTCMIISIV